ncbi:MAG: hypothetical protein ACRD1Y_10925 [Terriglobales bacterium]
MRHRTVAANLLSLCLSLVLGSGLAAQTLAGYEARGTATVTTARGPRTGRIEVELAGPSACKVTLDFSSPARRRVYSVVLNGTRAVETGPARMVEAAPLPEGPATGCALLAPEAAGPGVELATVPGTARLGRLSWTEGGHGLELSYAYGAASAALPSTITETVDGATRLRVTFSSMAAHNFPASTFALPVATGAAP